MTMNQKKSVRKERDGERERETAKQILNHAINAKSLSQMLPEAARQKTREKSFFENLCRDARTARALDGKLGL